MNENQLERIDIITDEYVFDDCVAVAIPISDNISTILTNEEIVYHFKENSTLYINKFLEDERKNKISTNIQPTFYEKKGLRKQKYINQILEFDKIYIEISEGTIKERYVIKDGNNAILITKTLSLELSSTKYMSYEEVKEMIENENIKHLDIDGGIKQLKEMISKNRILSSYKDYLLKAIEREENFIRDIDYANDLCKYARLYIDKLTFEDLDKEIIVYEDLILYSNINEKTQNINNPKNEIPNIKCINITFTPEDKYKVETYTFPITKNTLGHAKEIIERKSTEAKPKRKIRKK